MTQSHLPEIGVPHEAVARRISHVKHATVVELSHALVDEAVASIPQARPTARRFKNMEDRGKAACQKVKLGEITRARQCLTGAALAPGNDDTFDELQRKRPQEIQRELPAHVLGFVPESPLAFDRAQVQGVHLRTSEGVVGRN